LKVYKGAKLMRLTVGKSWLLCLAVFSSGRLAAAPAIPCPPNQGNPPYTVLVDATKNGLYDSTTNPEQGSPRNPATKLTFNTLPSGIATALENLLGNAASMESQRMLLRSWQGGTDGRIFATSNTGFLLYVVMDAGAKLEEIRDWSEKERELLVVQQVKDIAKITLQAAAAEPATVGVAKVCIALSYPRATVTFKVAAKPEAEKEIVKSMSLVTGRPEQLSLGVNVPLSRFSELKYDADKGRVVNRDAPGEYYASINWNGGDVFLPASAKKPLERFSIKFLVRASKKPLDAYGIAIGFELPSRKLFGFPLEGFSPFVGSVWRLEDGGVGPSGRVQHDRQQKLVAGISVDFGKFKEWWKK
jgi:hypothetical protein